jgi:hypothetical protein
VPVSFAWGAGVEFLDSFGVKEPADAVSNDVEEEVAECGIINPHEFLVEVELARSEFVVLGEGDAIGFGDWR